MILGIILGVYLTSGLIFSKGIITILEDITYNSGNGVVFDWIDYLIFTILIVIFHPIYIIFSVFNKELFMCLDDMDIFEFFLLIKDKVGRL